MSDTAKSCLNSIVGVWTVNSPSDYDDWRKNHDPDWRPKPTPPQDNPMSQDKGDKNMPTFIGWGAEKSQREYDEKKAARDSERWRTEQLIIEHTEKATNTKAVEVDGKLKYIPIAEAKKLGLVK